MSPSTTASTDDGRGYPCLDVPVLRRGPDAVQLGADRTGALVVGGLADPDAVAALLRTVDGTTATADLVALARRQGLGADWLPTVLRRCRHADLLTDLDGSSPARRPSARVRLVGSGPLADRTALALLGAGVGTVYRAPLAAGQPTSGPADGRAEGAGPPRTGQVAVPHWSKPEPGPHAPTLTVLLSPTLQVDRFLADRLTRSGQALLVAGPGPRGAVLGPAVLPGETSCLRCADLTRRDRDAAWPELLPQLVRCRRPLGPTAADWLLGRLPVEVLTLLREPGSATTHQPTAPPTAGTTIELDDRTGSVTTRHWPAHHGCGCQWTRAAEWGP